MPTVSPLHPKTWRARRESNPQPSDPKSDALSIELRARSTVFFTYFQWPVNPLRFYRGLTRSCFPITTYNDVGGNVRTLQLMPPRQYRAFRFGGCSDDIEVFFVNDNSRFKKETSAFFSPTATERDPFCFGKLEVNSMDSKEVLEQALALRPDERFSVVEGILRSLDEPGYVT